MCDTVFAFGQRGSFHFESPSRWSRGFLPDPLQSMFSEKEVASVNSMALGVRESYFISYVDNAGTPGIAYRGLPPALVEWLSEKNSEGRYARSFRDLKVTLGPYNESYFAHDGSSYKWMGLPPALLEQLEKKRIAGGEWTDAPRLVALGYNGNYLMITKAGSYAWKLNHYRGLDELLDAAKEKEWGVSWIQNFALNPYRIPNWVVQSTNGQVIGQGMWPAIMENFEVITKAIKEDTEKANNAAYAQKMDSLSYELRALLSNPSFQGK